MAAQKRTASKSPAAAKKAAPKKVTKSSAAGSSVKLHTEKAVNIYLGVIGKGIDALQENIESSRNESEKRMKELEKRGAKFRTELGKRFKKLKSRDLAEETKVQFDKLQDQVEDAVDTVKEKFNASKAA